MNPATFPTRLGEAPEATSRRTIPFDYAFRYELSGKPGNVINKTVTVSIEATFVAVSIGYGVVPKVTPIIFGPTDLQLASLPPRISLGQISLNNVLSFLEEKLKETSRVLRGETGPEAVLKNGFKLNPDIAEFVLQRINLSLDGSSSLRSILQNLFQVVGAPPENIQFLYAIFDEGSGREFQNEQILNIAGLGISDGDRPFRYFAQPITFAPQSTIRLEVREVSDFQGQLHVALHGYKALGGAGTPTGTIQRRAGRIRRR
jgi:hypothetical protein